MTCGPKAIFDQLTKSIVLTSTKHVWVYDDEKQWAAILKSMRSDYVKFVKSKVTSITKCLPAQEFL